MGKRTSSFQERISGSVHGGAGNTSDWQGKRENNYFSRVNEE